MAGKILIVDDVATNRIVLKVKLAAAYYKTIQASFGADAIRLAQQSRPDLILLDVELPDMDGIEVCRRLKALPETRDIPVVMITAFHDKARKIEALEAGADEVFWKPIDEIILLARMRSLLRARETAEQLGLRDTTYRDLGFAEAPQGFEGPALVGLIADAAATAMQWERALRPHLADRIVILDREEALDATGMAEIPDVFVIAVSGARPGDGLRLMSELRSRPQTRYAAICVVLPGTEKETAAVALDLGAHDLIEAQAEPAEMAQRIRMQIARKRQADRLRDSLADGLRLAMTDPLTGLHNRRYALPHLARIAERAAAAARQFAVMVIDLDRFKAINDRHGHAAGDAVLVEVARRLRANLRAVDLIARIGGEEFLVALPDTTFEAANATAERLRRTLSEAPVLLPDGTALRVTMSIGLALGNGPDRGALPIEEVIGRADRALLSAKADGRNQVMVGQSAA
ncbi:diguanylate cyclase [Albidovulum sp.]